MLKLEEVNWDKAKVVVNRERSDWYEEYDEAEGLFMGWIKLEKDYYTSVSFREFIKWLSKNGLEEQVKK